MPPRVIAVANCKGGSLKTTTAVNLAQALYDQGQSVLVVDMDEQCNATTALGGTHDGGAPDILSVIMRQATLDDAETTTPGGVGLVPATHELGHVDAYFSKKPGLHGILRTALQASGRPYDYVLIDCPGSMNNMTLTALAASTEILVPVASGSMELEAVFRFEQHLQESVDLLNPEARINHILVGRVELNQIADNDVLRALRGQYPDETMVTVIPKSVRVTESYSALCPVVTYAPTSKPAFAFNDAAKELHGRTQK